tara:strand:+ start:108 stop:287 length:180 start_codon:yes stop_codon:yes gene_type:complete
MSKIGNYVVEVQEAASNIPCPNCDGDGRLEATLAPDYFRYDDCDMCNGSGIVEGGEEDE